MTIEPGPAQMQWFDDALAHLTDKQHAFASGYLDTYQHGKKIIRYGFEIVVSEMLTDFLLLHL